MSRQADRTIGPITLLVALALCLVFPVWVAGLVLVGVFLLRVSPRLPAAWEILKHGPQVAPAPDGFALGDSPDGGPVVLSESQLAAHGLILGATGSGKTTSLLRLLCDGIERGLPVIAIDLKGSTSFADTIHTACQAAGRPLHCWRADGPGHWNPLQYGDATELKDKLISAERFTEPHYSARRRALPADRDPGLPAGRARPAGHARHRRVPARSGQPEAAPAPRAQGARLPGRPVSGGAQP
jgi:hypothetical protein